MIYRSSECDFELSSGKSYLRKILYGRDTGNEKQEKVGEEIYKHVRYKEEQVDKLWKDGLWKKINSDEAADEDVTIYERRDAKVFRNVRYCIITAEKKDGRCCKVRRFFRGDKIDEV